MALNPGIIDTAMLRRCFGDQAGAFPDPTAWAPAAADLILGLGPRNNGAALTVWPLEFILAARCAGKGRARISVEHILPNIANLLVVQGTIQFSLGILAEAGLSYVGLGAQPPTASWGRMLADAQTFFYSEPQLALYPGLAIVATVMGLNLMGDGLRDLLDPRLRRRLP